MLIHIFFAFKEGPWGGGNQFLKALREQLRLTGRYSETLEKAGVILFNSYPFGAESSFNELYKYRRSNPDAAIVHRVDGPISMVRGKDDGIDKVIFDFNDGFADGTVFQSDWCRKMCHNAGLKKNQIETVIINAPDGTIFFKKAPAVMRGGKTRLIAASWSSNTNKGFDIYSYLDRNLDFNRYEMTFVGNSPVKFRNIRHIAAVQSRELGELLRDSDIYLTASKNDPCSNSLIEALHCGLAAVVLNDGGHPELMGESGVAFSGTGDVISAIGKVALDPAGFAAKTRLPSIKEIAEAYYSFCAEVYSSKSRKRPNMFSLLRLKRTVFLNRALVRFKGS